jgi:hypothetical protein
MIPSNFHSIVNFRVAWKFPEYFTEHSSKLSPEDLAKYKKQQSLISQTVKLYEDPSYSDDNTEKSGAVMTLMQEVCPNYRFGGYHLTR